MSQSLARNWIHLVYSTKDRCPMIDTEVQPKLYAYQAGILEKLSSPARRIGGMDDHVHALFLLSKNYALKDIVEEVKKASSKWMKTSEGTGNNSFYWQGGYGAFSVSESNVDSVVRYIENQAEHHKTMTFQEELRKLFKLHQIEFDERYVWE